MELESIGTVIAERTYQRDGGGDVIVRVGMPVLFPEGGNHYCPFEIEGLYAHSMISRAGGVDAIQALVLALQKIRIILEHSEIPVRWLDDGVDLIMCALPDRIPPRDRLSAMNLAGELALSAGMFRQAVTVLTSLISEEEERLEKFYYREGAMAMRPTPSLNSARRLRPWPTSSTSRTIFRCSRSIMCRCSPRRIS